MTLSLARSSAAVPLKTQRPVVRMTTLSARSSASLLFCSTSTIDWPSSLQARNGAADLTHDLRRQSFGRLVQQQHARIGHQRPAYRQHLLLTSGQAGGKLVAAARCRRGNISIDALAASRRCRSGASAAGARHKVFAHRQLPNTRRPCGTRPMPARRFAPGCIVDRCAIQQRCCRSAAAGSRRWWGCRSFYRRRCDPAAPAAGRLQVDRHIVQDVTVAIIKLTPSRPTAASVAKVNLLRVRGSLTTSRGGRPR